MNVINYRKLSCLLLSAALVEPALAASHFKAVFIEQYDSNGDGQLDSVEFEAARRDRFSVMDRSQDGVVTEEEYVMEYEDRMDAQLARDRAGQVTQTEARFSALDKDEDGAISAEEFAASGERIFSRLDKDGNAVLAEDDYAAPDASMRDSLSREDILAERRRVLSMPSTHSLQGTLGLYDQDGDERVTRAEFDAQREQNFALADRDGDGRISPDEYLMEFEDRMDKEIERVRRAQVEQTRVRFEVLDKDESGEMTFAELQHSGHRSFKRWDTDGDGVVTWEEADPVEREFENTDVSVNAG